MIRVSTIVLLLLSPAAFLPAEEKAPRVKGKELKVAVARPEVMRPPSAVDFLEQDQAWTLRDDEGRELKAHLVSAHGEMVKIQRIDDEKEFDVPIEMFDSQTEDMIRQWMDRDPEAIDFSLQISASRELKDSSEFEMSGRSFKRSEWSYRVTLANQTRNDLNEAQIEYRIVYDDNIDFVRTLAVPGKGVNQQDGQAVDLPLMHFNDEIEFDTPVVETHTYEYKPTRGVRDFARDEVKGIWIRVIRNDEIIAEYKSNEAAMRDLSWDNEDKVEIKITNRFRDSFDESTTTD